MSDEMEMAAMEETPAEPARTLSQGLMGAAVLMMAATFLSAITGLIRLSSLYYLYAETHQAELSAYLQAFGIPDFIYFLVAGGALRTGFVPVFSQFMAREQAERAWVLFRNTLWIVTIFATLVVGLCMVFAGPLTLIAAWGWRDPSHKYVFDLTTHLMRIMFPAEIFMLIGGLLMGTLNAQKHFLWPALGPIFYNVVIIAAIWLSPLLGGVQAVAFAVPVSALLCNVLLQIPPLVKRGARFRFMLNPRQEDFRYVVRLALPVVFGLAIAEINTVVTKSMATWSNPALGALAFDVSNRLWKLPTRFIGAGIAIAVFAYLADHYARKNRAGFRRDFSFGMRSVIFLTLPPALAMLVLRTPIIMLLCPRTPADVVSLASNALFWYGLGIIPLSLVYVLARAFYARHDTITAFWVGAISVVVCVGLSLWLGRPDTMQVSGLALATSAANLANVVFLAVVLQHRVGGLDGRRILLSLLRQLPACAGFALVCWYSLVVCQGFLGTTGLTAKLAGVFLPVIPATLVFLALAWLFRVEELASAGQLIVRRFRRR